MMVKYLLSSCCIAALGVSPALANVAVPSWVNNTNLVFDEEFNGSSLDTTHWACQENYENSNSSDHCSNVTVSGGHAILTLLNANSGAWICSSDTAGDCSTNPSAGASLHVGDYAEARVSFPGNGTAIDNWGAWWASGPNWPAAGENDIAEGNVQLSVNYHSPSGAHNGPQPAGIWSNAFHVYGIYREAYQSIVYWDGKIVATYVTDDNGVEEDLMANIGNSTGPDCNCGGPTVYGAGGAILIDYVHVYRPGVTAIKPQTNYGGPGDDGSGSANGGGGGGGGGTNLLTNPGFETGTLAGWVNDGGTTVVTSPAPHSGTYSISVNTNGVDQYVATSNGKTYNWSMWIKATSGSTMQGGVGPNNINNTSTSTSWTQITGTVVPGTTADVWCAAASGTGYCDDISLSLPSISPTKTTVGPLSGTIGPFTGTEYFSDGSSTGVTVPAVTISVPSQSATGSAITIPAQTVPTP